MSQDKTFILRNLNNNSGVHLFGPRGGWTVIYGAHTSWRVEVNFDTELEARTFAARARVKRALDLIGAKPTQAELDWIDSEQAKPTLEWSRKMVRTVLKSRDVSTH